MRVRVKGEEIYVDIVTELNNYDWTNDTWTATRLIANSPFREERRPSFFVDLESGGWADSGSYDADTSSGNFIKLLSLLRNETCEDAEDYLHSVYGRDSGAKRKFVIPNTIYEDKRKKTMPCDSVEVLTSKYLLSRGICEETQRIYGVGRGRLKGFTAIPWRLPDGSIGTIMYRSTTGKQFHYEKASYSRGELVYGIDVIHKTREKTAVICEAPIDAMSWHTATGGRIVGIAVGGTSFSRRQRDLILRSGVRKLIVAGDNDAPGREFNRRIIETLRGRVITEPYDYAPYKDANEAIKKIKKEFTNIS